MTELLDVSSGFRQLGSPHLYANNKGTHLCRPFIIFRYANKLVESCFCKTLATITHNSSPLLASFYRY